MLDQTNTYLDTPVTPRSDAPERPNLIRRMFITPLRRWMRRRATIAELHGLSDRMLADIGLSRNDIPHVIDLLVADGVRAATAERPVVPSDDRYDELRQAA